MTLYNSLPSFAVINNEDFERIAAPNGSGRGSGIRKTSISVLAIQMLQKHKRFKHLHVTAGQCQCTVDACNVGPHALQQMFHLG
jgi:hypothetical protein